MAEAERDPAEDVEAVRVVGEAVRAVGEVRQDSGRTKKGPLGNKEDAEKTTVCSKNITEGPIQKAVNGHQPGKKL
jgi:hypothetical protein